MICLFPVIDRLGNLHANQRLRTTAEAEGEGWDPVKLFEAPLPRPQ